ncbi:hypothetical protein C5167_039583 [Papaver somniferum]|uniref:Uncharacterized protein n=1 Tax=Papaver somniferum TaxID=3469 RepID=A0A4Y7IFV8_PAPSO|nr:hypothetical protein C5167_039583 [Papaver somniferum]
MDYSYGIKRSELKNGYPRFFDLPVEDKAATRLQTTFRGYKEEWCGGRGSDTMEEIRSRMQQGEDASIKRQWVMTYAFSSGTRVFSIPSQLVTLYSTNITITMSWLIFRQLEFPRRLR